MSGMLVKATPVKHVVLDTVEHTQSLRTTWPVVDITLLPTLHTSCTAQSTHNLQLTLIYQFRALSLARWISMPQTTTHHTAATTALGPKDRPPICDRWHLLAVPLGLPVGPLYPLPFVPGG